MSTTEGVIRSEYYEWITGLVLDGPYSRGESWTKLMKLLDSLQFFYTMAMDENRADDGLNLRYRFSYESKYIYEDVENAFCESPCTILEMMVALALRCEEHITDDPESGNRTGKWFFEMIDSLGLGEQIDECFDMNYCIDVLERFINREYDYDGKGGLFTLHHPRKDMRLTEIWYQMMWYLNEDIYGKEK